MTHTNIGKWFADLKSHDRSKQIFESVIAEYGINHPATHFHFGFILKKEQAYEDAVSSFKIAATGLTGRERIIALEELAKLYEHKLKELNKALDSTEEAIRLLKVDSYLTASFRIRSRNDFLKREIRITRKLFPGQAHKPTKNG